MKNVGSPRPTNSKEFRENYSAMESAIKKVDSLAKRIIQGGSESSRARHLKRGKMLPRDRVGNLLDTGSFFLEVGLFDANGEYKDEVPSAGAIAGVGLVSKKLCMIIPQVGVEAEEGQDKGNVEGREGTRGVGEGVHLVKWRCGGRGGTSQYRHFPSSK